MQYGSPQRLPFADEGRAMMQIVHDVAPGAALAFHTAINSEADFANGIIALADAGATVIVDDVGYFDEPFFQDGIVAQAIDTVARKGVVYFSAAGNDGQNSYENTAPSFSIAGTGANAGEMLLNFDASGAATTTALQVAIPKLIPGEFIALIVQWDQPYLTGAPDSPGSTSSIDLCVSASGYTVINLDGAPKTCTGPNTTGTDTSQTNNGDAEQVLILGNPANAAGDSAATTISVVIGLANGTPPPGRIKLVVADDGAGAAIDPGLATNSPTLQGHPSATGAAAVAAAFFPQTPRCGTSPALLESFSAEGGEPILFGTNGTRLATPEVRQKPDFTGPDGGNTSFFGVFLAKTDRTDSSSVAGCQNDASYLNFFGTSAAAPHAAGAAALMLQANPTVSAAQILQNLRSSALPMGGNAPDYDSGYGFLQVDAAIALLPPGPPVIRLTSSTITAGSSTTLSWLAVNATACSASDSWNGAQSSSGTLAVTPTSAGTLTYTLTCTTAAGSKTSSAVLTVQDPPTQQPSSGGGGGAVEILTLISLCGLLLARMSAQSRERCQHRLPARRAEAGARIPAGRGPIRAVVALCDIAERLLADPI
ncbi:MAG TPA: S8 family serine peptidase [Steroidobacteraceae bacterium]|nr:S8 family serine peptidase [Steroidobacteraceae bacterium]